MTEQQEFILAQLGFRFGINGPHAARTMMLDDLRLLLAHTAETARRTDYAEAIIAGNVLGKATKKARELALRHLGTLYGLDDANPVFRALRRLWHNNAAAQPMLALLAALARDPLLRASEKFMLGLPVGGLVAREDVEAFLERTFPDRFSPSSLKSFAQNVAGTWTAAGVLAGHRRKLRTTPAGTAEATAMALLLGHLQGRSGQRLFNSEWISVLCSSPDELIALTNSASHRGLLVFMNAGGVKEVRFPGYLTPEEERIRQEVSHVI
ncbi:hypothetical protein [Pelomonas sp. KK5]|uniref:hypothetical protein n=1 Tax=Pelomonas sp. KK5 TaxID=1855730 RepID=UPI001E3F9636|nr:hypothetical protein [Pelomonas sp. KK5]